MTYETTKKLTNKPCSNIQIGLEMKIKELECTERQTDRQTDREPLFKHGGNKSSAAYRVVCKNYGVTRLFYKLSLWLFFSSLSFVNMPLNCSK